MAKEHFDLRKKNQLDKEDKSLKQGWDKKIKKLCEKINLLEDFYTTSSCSGRVLLIIDEKEKRDDLFLFCSHEFIDFEGLKNALENIKNNRLIYFKTDPCILHVACRSLEDAQKIHDLAKNSGWKRCGIISSNKRFVVELNGTSRIEMPIVIDSNVLVDDKFIKILVDESNRKLKISWDLIKRFESEVDKNL